MAWEKVPDNDIPLKARRTAIKDTAEFIEVMHAISHNKIERGQSLVLRRMPKIPGMPDHRVIHNFAAGLKTEFSRQGLPWVAKIYDEKELIVRRIA
jgi:hypothetical protein